MPKIQPVQIGVDVSTYEASDGIIEYLSQEGRFPAVLEYVRINPDRNEIQIKGGAGQKVVIRNGTVTFC